jgi:pimeloyl-ACP methyl ester carboxylesterase
MVSSAVRSFLLAFLILGAIYLLLLAAAWASQERIVWQPPHSPDIPGTGAQRLDYAADDGQPLYAYLAGDPSRARGLLLAFHGNAELAAWNLPWAEEVVRRTGWSVMLPEYRGYGGLGGASTYASSQHDARAALRVARERLGVDSSRIAYFGHSLGSAIAIELADRHPPAAVLLVAPFTSAREMAGAMRGFPLAALWGTIGRIHFDTRAKVAALDAPVGVAHGDRDRVVPVRMGRDVHAAARVRGRLLLVPGAGHNDVVQVAGDRYWAWLGDALRGEASRTTPGTR